MTRFFVILIISIFSFNWAIGQEWKERTDLPATYPTPPQKAERMFYIQRNLNSNVISYDVNLDSQGKIDDDHPIDNYWMRYTGKRNGLREELTWFQNKLAYGYSAKATGEHEDYQVKLTAYKERPILITKKNGTWLPIMKINGKDSQLVSLYVYTDESGMLPKVIHIDIHGKDLTTGQKITERFYNN